LRENADHVFASLTALGEYTREAGETSMLDLGTILEEIRAIADEERHADALKRQQAEENERNAKAKAICRGE
jgi:hypothetical protein